jgi:protein-S-isoprenylcysteine O-methyltransferase Ste14
LTRGSNLVAIAVASAVVGTVLFVLLYEEPTPRKVFGAQYEELL